MDQNYCIVIGNNTAKTECIEYAKIKIVEVSSQGLMITMPTKVCAMSHNLSVFLFPQKKTYKLKSLPQTSEEIKDALVLETKVTDIAKGFEEGISIFTLEFTKHNEETWQMFLKSLEKTQDDLDAVFKQFKN